MCESNTGLSHSLEETFVVNFYELQSLFTSRVHRCFPTLSICCVHTPIPFCLLL